MTASLSLWPNHGEIGLPYITGRLRTKPDGDIILVGAWRGFLDGQGETNPPHCAGPGSHICSCLIGRGGPLILALLSGRRSMPQEAPEQLSHWPPTLNLLLAPRCLQNRASHPGPSLDLHPKPLTLQLFVHLSLVLTGRSIPPLLSSS